jgi:poly(3-hydroxybutyrate) depolymerase
MLTILFSFILARPCEISLPENMDRPALIIVLHGHGGTQEGLAASLGYIENTIVVAPQGIGASWDAGHCCGQAYAGQVDDVAFISGLIDAMIDLYGVDPGRVYLLGFSNGGMLCHKAAGLLAHKIAAFADVSGCAGGRSSPYMDTAMPQQPSERISVFMAHGMLDEIVPFAQDWSAPATRWDLPFAAGVQFWRDACGYDGERWTLQADRYTLTSYGQGDPICGGMGELVTMVFPEGRHDLACWPVIIQRVLEFFGRNAKAR